MRYKNYHLSKREWTLSIVEYIGIVLAAAYLFYDEPAAAGFMLPFGFAFIRLEKKKYYKNNQDKLKEQFLKSLQSLSTSLAAGLSCENAFYEAENDARHLYGENAIIVKELDIINVKIAFGERIEDALRSFADRYGIREIEDFAMIFQVAKDSGTGFSRIISNCTELMQTAKDIEEEMRVLIRGKQYELRIMSIIPPAIILYLRFSSGSFIAALYHNIIGNIIMTACLIIYIMAIIISEKICDIEI